MHIDGGELDRISATPVGFTKHVQPKHNLCFAAISYIGYTSCV
jgi:hypothetical protein